jgi:hypothetical protein
VNIPRNKDKNKELHLNVMKGLAVLFALILATAFTACGLDSSSSQSGQIIAVSALSGGLEVGRASTISVDLRNNASFALAPFENLTATLGAREPEARGIVAELQSREEGVVVLSGPQNAGALGPGENRSVGFMVRAGDEAGIGIHPLDLKISYSLLSGIEATGEEDLPDVTFHYREMSHTIPLEVEATLGPRIELQEVRGMAVPEAESEIEMAFANRGDSRAERLEAQIVPQEPFGCIHCAAEIEALDPGEEAKAKFTVIVNNSNSHEGEYALPLCISYMHAGERRLEETAALVQVGDRSWMRAALMPTALLMLLLLAFGVYFYFARGGGRKRRPKRRL